MGFDSSEHNNDSEHNNESEHGEHNEESTKNNEEIVINHEPKSSRPASASDKHRLDSARSNKSTGRMSRSKTNLSFISSLDPYLKSVNDLKYIGDQFKVGKLDPSLKQPHEIRFEKMFQSRLKKLTQPCSPRYSVNEQLISEFKRTNDPKLQVDPHFNLTNELKYTGSQFKVGKLDSKLQSPFEKRFQERFKSHLKVLQTSNNKVPTTLSYADLKELQAKLALCSRDQSTRK